MARKKIHVGSRGPSRAANSTVKIRCAYHKCKSLQDCKNVSTGLQLRRARACLDKCRKSLRADAALLKFCCLRHLEPAIDIEQVNKKTVARRVPIPGQLAQPLHGWIHEHPLQGKTSQWPFQGQGCDPATFLFPSANVQGQRDWSRCMTRQAFHLRLQRACRVIQQERTVLRRQSRKRPPFKHPFQDMDMSKLGSHSFKRSAQFFECVDLSKIGTHSLKRSSITLLKQKCTSAAVLQSISGTSTQTLDRYYDQPTTARQLQALGDTFHGIWGQLQESGAPGARDENSCSFCAHCGKKRGDLAWAVCPWCGWHYPQLK